MTDENKKQCPTCPFSGALTTDHTIPKWLQRRLDIFGFKIQPPPNRKVCATCNTKKGGQIDYKNPAVRKFMLEFVEKVILKLKSK